MKKLFIADKGFERDFDRIRANGHKRLTIESDVDITKAVKLHTVGTDLVMSCDGNADGEDAYMILCQEFGLAGGSDFVSDISVIFLDEGWMLVTLYKGALILNLEDQLLMPATTGVETPKVVKSEIYWVNANILLEYGKYYGVKGQFMYDVEWFFNVSGSNKGNMPVFSIQHPGEKDIDLSLGAIALYEQQLKLKEDAKEAQKIVKMMQTSNSSSGFEFDEVESEEPEQEDENGDYDDWDY